MADEPKKADGVLRRYAQAENMVQAALAIPIGACAGFAVGYLIDRRFHQQWIEIVGVVLGAAGGFLQIFRAASRYLNKDQ